MAIVATIPARVGSTRLPGKPLSDIQGLTLVERLHERARRARTPDRGPAATDDERLVASGRASAGVAVPISLAHASKIDRAAEAARTPPPAGIVETQGRKPRALPTVQKGRVA